MIGPQFPQPVPEVFDDIVLKGGCLPRWNPDHKSAEPFARREITNSDAKHIFMSEMTGLRISASLLANHQSLDDTIVGLSVIAFRFPAFRGVKACGSVVLALLSNVLVVKPLLHESVVRARGWWETATRFVAHKAVVAAVDRALDICRIPDDDRVEQRAVKHCIVEFGPFNGICPLSVVQGWGALWRCDDDSFLPEQSLLSLLEAIDALSAADAAAERALEAARAFTAAGEDGGGECDAQDGGDGIGGGDARGGEDGGGGGDEVAELRRRLAISEALRLRSDALRLRSEALRLRSEALRLFSVVAEVFAGLRFNENASFCHLRGFSGATTAHVMGLGGTYGCVDRYAGRADARTGQFWAVGSLGDACVLLLHETAHASARGRDKNLITPPSTPGAAAAAAAVFPQVEEREEHARPQPCLTTVQTCLRTVTAQSERSLALRWAAECDADAYVVELFPLCASPELGRTAEVLVFGAQPACAVLIACRRAVEAAVERLLSLEGAVGFVGEHRVLIDVRWFAPRGVRRSVGMDVQEDNAVMTD